MFSRAYTSLSRITIEAADCKFNYQHINGHLTISVEPLDPVFPTGNRDPLLGQTVRQRIDNTTRNNDTTARDKDNPQPSTSYAQHNPMLADSTHRSPKVPSDSLEPLQLNPSAVPSTSNLSPVPLKYEEANYPQDDDSDTNSENDEQQNTAPTHMPDPIHMPKPENEMPQEDIPQNETQIERPHTPDPNNPIQDNTEYANPNYEMPEEMPNAQPQPTTSNANPNSALANFMESPNFQETTKKMTLQVGETTFNRIAKNPRLVKQWILQVIHKFPGLLDDLTDDTVEFMDTNNGPVRILQPTTSQNPQPLDQQDHDTSQVKQETPHPPLTLQQQEENNDTPTIPSSISPGLLSSEDSDSDSDCIIEKIEKASPIPKVMKRTAPPPEVSSPHVILKKIPHKQGNGSYTVTTTQDMNGQTTGQTTGQITGQATPQNNTGLEHNHTPKRPRLQDQTPQPSTSTGTTTPQTHKDRKHKKNKKDNKTDKKKDKKKDKDKNN